MLHGKDETDNRPKYTYFVSYKPCKKVAHTRLPSVGFRSWSRFFAVSLQVMWVINPAVGCHYFPPGLQLLPQPLRGLLPILLLGEQRHNGCEQFASRRRRDCDLNPSHSAPESSTLTTRLPSHPLNHVEYIIREDRPKLALSSAQLHTQSRRR